MVINIGCSCLWRPTAVCGGGACARYGVRRLDLMRRRIEVAESMPDAGDRTDTPKNHKASERLRFPRFSLTSRVVHGR